MSNKMNPTSQDFSNTSRIDLLVKIINRYDTYITSTNAKASLIIAWNGVVIGSILLKYQEIINQFSCMSKVFIFVPPLLVICGIIALLSNAIIFGVIFPFLTPNLDGGVSIIYFGSVAKTASQDYLKAVQTTSVDVIIEDLAQQASTLATGLDAKMRRLQKSIWAIYAELAVIAILLVLYACSV